MKAQGEAMMILSRAMDRNTTAVSKIEKTASALLKVVKGLSRGGGKGPDSSQVGYFFLPRSMAT